MDFLAKVFKRLVYEKRRLVFYGYDPKQGDGRADPQIQVYDSWEAIPPHFRKIAAPAPWRNTVYYRMKRGQARLLAYSEDGMRLGAYVWLQDWKPFLRKFGAIADRGIMMGYGWTAPAMRRRGLFGRMLAHSLFVCPKDRPIIGHTTPDNMAIRHALQKVGFYSLGEWDLRQWFGMCVRLRRISP